MASDLISREALLDSLEEAYKELKKIHDGLQYVDERRICGAQLSTFAEIVLRARKAPSVDAVEVVRCKDCVFYQPFIQEMYKGKGDCEEHDAMVCDDDFCSYGRKLVMKDATE